MNFVADHVSNTELPRVMEIIQRVASNGDVMPSEDLVDRCLDVIAPLETNQATRNELIKQVDSEDEISWNKVPEQFKRQIGDTLALIVATREHQFC